MKFGSWLTLVLICAGFAATPAKAISPDLWQNDLARAQTFVIGPWELYQFPLFFGRAANERELHLLLKERDAAARMRWIIAHGTAEGQMYGLYGLRLLHDAEFEQFASRLEEQPGEILTTTLAIGFHKTRQEVVQRIRENDFHHM
ncbi:MAG: hypothetical protein JO170_08025 [Verrucomicrobia bacterium]|nr:hypothetical protein [Verrucomicrobiota bacterium]